MELKKQQRILVGEFTYIVKRGQKGIWSADYCHQGQHRRRSLKTRNEKEARRRALLLEGAKNEGATLALFGDRKPPAVSGCCLKDAIDRFLNYQVTERRRPKTLVKYRGVLETFASDCARQQVESLHQIHLPVIDSYRERRSTTLAQRSMNFEGHLLKQFFGWCVARNLMPKNPLESLKFQKVKLIPKGSPSMDQVNAILAHATPYRLPMCATLAFTGMRSGELCRLQPQDVDLDGNWIRIESRPGLETKTGDSRKVPIHPRLRKLLETFPRRQRPWFFTAVASATYPEGNHWVSTKKLNEDFNTKLQQLGIPAGRNGGYTIHSLRHFFRTYAVNNGIPERVINIWLGHAPDRSMGSVYYHLSDEESQRFMSELKFPD